MLLKYTPPPIYVICRSVIPEILLLDFTEIELTLVLSVIHSIIYSNPIAEIESIVDVYYTSSELHNYFLDRELLVLEHKAVNVEILIETLHRLIDNITMNSLAVIKRLHHSGYTPYTMDIHNNRIHIYFHWRY